MNLDKETIKTATNILLILILAYTAYWMTQPQGQELIECRTYQPLINLTKTCAANSPTGNWTLICVSQEEAAIRNMKVNTSRWTT
jgi:hypothetical protein